MSLVLVTGASGFIAKHTIRKLLEDGYHVRGTVRNGGFFFIANYGTMLQFTVANPPDDLDTAYQLAKEHETIATSTFAPAGIVRRHYAADLVGRTRWLLHDRP